MKIITKFSQKKIIKTIEKYEDDNLTSELTENQNGKKEEK